ncbi:hypothetical protein UA08_05419 [Talaromyces atroroseus]|uniref:Transcription factor domain-containing protein n=1 Tax=Talaromyces atroroseus TaxID=1441469 RepID=A0A225AJI6_TALAT|nr:hypothetical protein UA08_05419 [Talaromyces atroroseus]OKL59523.1 hypothetical protein UA08_05419 [Talaromyces atroroseus]
MRDALRGRKEQPKSVTFSLEKVSVAEDSKIREVEPGNNDKSIQKPLHSWPFPGDTHTRARELIYFMTSESDYVFRPFRTVWFSMALTDATALQLCLANAAMFMAQRRQPGMFQYDKCTEALEYYGRSLCQVTKRLENSIDCTSTGVLVTVLGFICHDLYVGIWDRWAAHMNGLRRIIQLCGGYKNISHNLTLWASWYDILGSANRDTYPQFPVFMCDIEPSTYPVTLRTPLLQQIERVLFNQKFILNCLCKVQGIANIINNHYQNPDFWRREDDLSPLYMLGPITHELLSMHRLDVECDYDSEVVFDSTQISREILRLSMLILLAALKTMYSFIVDESEELNILSTKFSRLLTLDRSRPSLLNKDGILHTLQLQLWAMLTVATLQPLSASRTLYVTEIRKCMNLLGMVSATDAFQLARDIAWIDVVAGTTLGNEPLINAINNAPLLT